LIYTGTGWDTVFGGPGCDYIYSEDGGDVIWGGDCDPAATLEAQTPTVPVGMEEETPNNAANAGEGPYQMFFIVGTGPDPENYTVVMDFWHETAMPHNILCLYPDRAQGVPGSGACTVEQNFAADTTAALTAQSSCLTAVDIMSGRAPLADMHDPKRTRNSGCKNDGGPLWISVELADEETGLASSTGGGDAFRSVFGKIFQKKQKFTSRRRSRRSSRYSQVGSYPTETKSDLVECMALQLCTATGST